MAPPSREQWGSWDELPEDPPVESLDLSHPVVVDGIERRDRLKAEWQKYRHYPHGFWPDDLIQRLPDLGEKGRNEYLRRSWGGIRYLNGLLKKWSSDRDAADSHLASMPWIKAS